MGNFWDLEGWWFLASMYDDVCASRAGGASGVHRSLMIRISSGACTIFDYSHHEDPEFLAVFGQHVYLPNT